MYPTLSNAKLLLKARQGSPGLPYHKTARTLPLKFGPEVSYPNSQEEGDSPRSPLSFCVYLHSVINVPIFLPGLASAFLL